MKSDALSPDLAALLRQPVLFIEEVACLYRVSRDTIERRGPRNWRVRPRGRVAGRWQWATADIVDDLGLEVTSP